MEIQKSYVANDSVKGPLRLLASQAVQPAQPAAQDQPGGMRSVFVGVGAGTTANYAWKGFQATNTLDASEIGKYLIKNGLAPEHAPDVAQKTLDVIRSEPTKVLLVAVSAGGAAWAVLEAGDKFFGMRSSALRKLWLSLAVALLAGAAYYFLRKNGYMQ